jgi:hypothetical protein
MVTLCLSKCKWIILVSQIQVPSYSASAAKTLGIFVARTLGLCSECVSSLKFSSILLLLDIGCVAVGWNVQPSRTLVERLAVSCSSIAHGSGKCSATSRSSIARGVGAVDYWS